MEKKKEDHLELILVLHNSALHRAWVSDLHAQDYLAVLWLLKDIGAILKIIIFWLKRSTGVIEKKKKNL